MTVTVDASRCIGCGMCAYAAPGVFRIVGAVSTVLPHPDEAQASRAAGAANGCPVNAIRVRRQGKIRKK
ncbi:MAG: ferredoxin [Oscillibacter sp.]|nr:ferredoxin [Oscillibacter sp.]